MKHISTHAAMLLVMGMLLLPGCDEDKGISGADLLAMKYIANSKYYLRFDVDYDNDGSADEHVEMRVTMNFDFMSSNYYETYFTGKNGHVFILLSDETNEPVTYTDKSIKFRFGYDYDILDYTYENESGHDFEFNITEWNTSQKIIKAQFNGEIVYNHGLLTEDIITISNGELFARVIHYKGE